MAKNPHTTNIGGDDFWPLNVEQRTDFHEAALNANAPLEKLTGVVLLHTGIRNAEFHHMRPNWLEFDEDGELRIVIPATEDCIGGAGKTGKNNKTGANLHKRGHSCHKCRTNTPGWVKKAKRKKNFHDEKWHPKTKAAANRPIPVEEMSEETASILESWFDLNNDIPILHKSVNARVERIKNRADIDREVTAHDLRTTFATHLARHSVDRAYTAELMGHASVESTDPYYKFVGADLKSELSDKLND